MFWMLLWLLCASAGTMFLLAGAVYVANGIVYAEWDLDKQQGIMDRFKEVRMKTLEEVGCSYIRCRVVFSLAALTAFFISGSIFF